MARPVRLIVASASLSKLVPLDYNRDPFNVGVGVTLSAGAVLTYTVEHTYDDVQAPTYNPATAVWFSNASLVSKSTSSDGNYAFPVIAIRLNVTAFTSGTATLNVIQAGMPGVN